MFFSNINIFIVNWAELAQRWIMSKPSTMSPAASFEQSIF